MNMLENLKSKYYAWRLVRATKFIKAAGLEVARTEWVAGARYIVDENGTYWRMKRNDGQRGKVTKK